MRVVDHDQNPVGDAREFLRSLPVSLTVSAEQAVLEQAVAKSWP